jgi:hypothetical protein
MTHGGAARRPDVWSFRFLNCTHPRPLLAIATTGLVSLYTRRRPPARWNKLLRSARKARIAQAGHDPTHAASRLHASKALAWCRASASLLTALSMSVRHTTHAPTASALAAFARGAGARVCCAYHCLAAFSSSGRTAAGRNDGMAMDTRIPPLTQQLLATRPLLALLLICTTYSRLLAACSWPIGRELVASVRPGIVGSAAEGGLGTRPAVAQKTLVSLGSGGRAFQWS